ncbi:hypothetical protein IFR04_009737 [Cadophora malorum]|uniref:Uncharacterized protein n=1 Tax=Cadophora malorum TaxID=108018 RepID=A0A8H7W487_9HELO|nr:hypothetical protein IFR04_009737 [Cadophora malorum]
MAPDPTKTPKKSRSGSKAAKKSVSIMGSLLSSAFQKDKSAPSKSSKRPEGKDPKERTKSESKIQRQVIHVMYRRKSSLKSEFFRDESQTPQPSSPSLPSQAPQPPMSKVIPQPHVRPPQGRQPTKPPPTKLQSVHVTEKDQKMASRQLKIEKLAAKELEEQEAWALEKLIESGRCPQNWGWEKAYCAGWI